MRWFASFLVTSLLAILAAVVLWLRNNPPFGVTEVADGARWLVPQAGAAFVLRFQIPLIFGLCIGIRIVLTWLWAYTESSTDGSPRGRAGKSAVLGDTVFHLFHNPVRWWMTAFTLLVGVVVFLSGLYIWFFEQNSLLQLMWSLTALFGSTLLGSMVNPDKIDCLITRTESAPDPMLNIPGESA